MRSLVVIFVVGLCATAVAAPPARRIVVIVPPAAEGDDADLGLVMQTRASELLVRGGPFVDVHAKQVLRVARLEGMSRAALASPDGASLIGRRFGAERVIYATLARDKDGWLLTVATSPPDQAPRKVLLPASSARAVEEGARALAVFAAGPGGSIPAASPETASDDAMSAYAHCYATLVQQPMALDTPLVLDEGQLNAAIGACQRAVASDPNFQGARAALGLAQALMGKDDDAVRTLAGVAEGDGYLPLYWIARYWLVTRYQSVDAGALALKKAIDLHPYFLLAFGYLAEHESALHHDEAALADWRAYLIQLPKSAFVRDGISHSLARLGRNEEALAEARAASADAPDDREAKLEVGSRELDAGNAAAAIALLEPLAHTAGARAEVFLRLGYAYAHAGDTADADKWLIEAEGAQRPDEWRTRARARLDRGVLLVKNGHVAEGQELLVAAERGGLGHYIELQKDDELRRMVTDAEAAEREKNVRGFETKIPKEASPFQLDGAGEIAPAQIPPPAPKMFEVLRF